MESDPAAEPSILIFGGTFDPPHLAHGILPPLVARAVDCAGVLYVPTSSNPLKDRRPAPPEHRLAMLRLALHDIPDAEVCTIELERTGPSYTVDTLEALDREHGPDVRWRLMMGADAAASFHRWRRPDRILQLATPVVVLRPPWSERRLREALAATASPDEVDRWMAWTVEVPQLDISAADVRRRLEAGKPVAQLLHPAVLDYIRAHGLYGAGRPARNLDE
jgi:nicotinate-nucleotide adenylyltransferase